MTTRRLGTLLLGAVLAGSGAYLFVYLYRWEWNRAHTAGVFLIVSEIALVALLLDARMSRMESRIEARAARRSQQVDAASVREHIEAAAPAPRSHFAWLRPDSTNVFVPALMGAGMVMSALAWVIERLGRATARPVLEQDLSRRLGSLWFRAADGLVPPPSTSGQVDGIPDVLLAPRRR